MANYLYCCDVTRGSYQRHMNIILCPTKVLRLQKHRYREWWFIPTKPEKLANEVNSFTEPACPGHPISDCSSQLYLILTLACACLQVQNLTYQVLTSYHRQMHTLVVQHNLKVSFVEGIVVRVCNCNSNGFYYQAIYIQAVSGEFVSQI